ncbi:MAG: AzlD domain-containing protein [Acidimicrobiales bacterium]|nr:AzlD domain-containing protein [Acidimicrobiales bacterium]
MSPALQVLLAGVGTYLIRVSAIALGGRAARPSPATEATLRLIGPAVLAAIVADRLVLVDGAPTLRWSWLVAAAVAAIVAWRWRSAGITMAAGMVAVWLLTAW